jgi:hypothetical protein
MSSIKSIVLLSLLLISIIGTLSYAQLGEEAGQPSLNISIGSSNTFNYSILNSGSAPIPYTIVLPTLNTIPHNATPIVTVTPMNGTLAPNSQQIISIKVSVPSSDKPHLKWQGVLSVVEIAPVANVTSGAGAVIRAGVAKILTIYSAPPKSLPLIYYIIAIVVVVVVVVSAIYTILLKRRHKAHAAMVAKAAKSALYAKGTKRGKAMNRVAAKKKKTAGSAATKKRVKRNDTSRKRKPRKTPRKHSAKKTSSIKSKRRRT